jgi:F-type H+/Na+-transporting ATPase subunit beta
MFFDLRMMTKSMPSEDGYQPTLFSELAQFHERLVSTSENILTTIEAIYIPNDDILDQAVQSIFSYLDAAVVFSRDIYQQNLLPAVDVLASTSTALNPAIVGEDHYKTVIEATALIRKAESLERIVTLIGKSELSPEDRVSYERAKKLRNFMTQDLFVLEAQMGEHHTGKLVSCKQVIDGAKAIISGELDNAEEESLLYIGDINDVKI